MEIREARRRHVAARFADRPSFAGSPLGHFDGRIPPELPDPDAFGFSFGCFGFFFSLRMSLFPMIVSLVSVGVKRMEIDDIRPAIERPKHYPSGFNANRIMVILPESKSGWQTAISLCRSICAAC